MNSAPIVTLSIAGKTTEELQSLVGWELGAVLNECIVALLTLERAARAARIILSAARIAKASEAVNGERDFIEASCNFENIRETQRMVRDVKSSVQSLIRAVP